MAERKGKMDCPDDFADVTFRPDGAVAMSIFPWVRKCGEKIVICAGKLEDEKGVETDCPDRMGCQAYDPDLNEENPDFNKVFQNSGEEETMNHTGVQVLAEYGTVKCQLCKFAFLEKKSCRDSNNPRVAAKCQRYEPEADRVLARSIELRKQAYRYVIMYVNDFNVLKKVIRDTRAKMAEGKTVDGVLEKDQTTEDEIEEEVVVEEKPTQ